MDRKDGEYLQSRDEDVLLSQPSVVIEHKHGVETYQSNAGRE
jgi:hypothetical protein